MAQLTQAEVALFSQMQDRMIHTFMEHLNQQRAKGQICTPNGHQGSGQACLSSEEHNRGSSNGKLLSFGSTLLSTQARVAAIQKHSRSQDSKGRFCLRMLSPSDAFGVKVRTACSCLELAHRAMIAAAAFCRRMPP